MKKRKAYIDGIRAFSVCLIILYHFGGSASSFGVSRPLLYGFANGNWGNIGVFLFFMISGNVTTIIFGDSLKFRQDVTCLGDYFILFSAYGWKKS